MTTETVLTDKEISKTLVDAGILYATQDVTAYDITIARAIEQDNKRSVISALYEIHAGTTRDKTIEIAGRTFGYKLGIDCNSNTKQAAALEGIESLIAQITA